MKAVNRGFSTYLGAGFVALDVCGSWGQLSAAPDGDGTEPLAVRCRGG